MLFGMGARCLDQEARGTLSVVLNEHITLASFVENDGYDAEEGDNHGCNPNNLLMVRRAWPFLAEPNPALREMT